MRDHERHLQHPVLRLGSTGPRVRALEKRLDQLGDLKGPVDDQFDARTAAAVLRYKRANGWVDPTPQVGARMAAELDLPAERPLRTPNKLKGATYNCRIGRDPAVVAKTVSRFAHGRKLDFMQLQEISGYHKALENIPGYKLITFPSSKDHGIDWEMARGCRLSDLKVGPRGGSDHSLVTFPVTRRRG